MGTKRKQLYHKIYATLRHHPKLIASAKTLKLPSVYVLGHITSMWLGALDFAEDGDLWRGDEESFLRFFESLAEIPESPAIYLDVFRRDRWLDGWLIHDWLDYTSELLVSRYSSHNRQLLVEIYRKHNRVYGKAIEESFSNPYPDGIQGKLLGTDWEVIGDNPASFGSNSDPPVTHSLKPQTLNPIAQEKRNVSNCVLTPLKNDFY